MSLDLSTYLGSPNGLSGEPDDLAWLAGLLRETIAAVAAEEADTFRKAGMIARLSGLFLRASRAAELKQAYKELTHRNAELEERLAALETAASETELLLAPAPVGPGEGAAPAERRPTGALVATPAAPVSAGPFPLPSGAHGPAPPVAGAPVHTAAPP